MVQPCYVSMSPGRRLLPNPWARHWPRHLLRAALIASWLSIANHFLYQTAERLYDPMVIEDVVY